MLLQLEQRKTETEAMCEGHREKIQQLWDRLQVPQEERQAFNQHMVTSRKRNLEAVGVRPAADQLYISRGQMFISETPSALHILDVSLLH